MVTSGKQLRYGLINRLDTAARLTVPMGASEVIALASGRFVKNDGSGRAEIAGDGDTALMGWVEGPTDGNFNASGIFTASATEGATKCSFIPANGALSVVFRIPINSGTYVAAMLGESCDISVSSNIQGAQLDASAEDTLVIVGGDEVNNAWVDVMINPAKIAPTGVV